MRKWLGDTNVQYHLFDKESGASAHCQIGNMSQAHVVIFEWLNNTVLLKNDHYFPLLKDLKIEKNRDGKRSKGVERPFSNVLWD
jgi:hypothetical protein